MAQDCGPYFTAWVMDYYQELHALGDQLLSSNASDPHFVRTIPLLTSPHPQGCHLYNISVWSKYREVF
jgi:hypothetical protein